MMCQRERASALAGAGNTRTRGTMEDDNEARDVRRRRIAST